MVQMTAGVPAILKKSKRTEDQLRWRDFVAALVVYDKKGSVFK